MFERALSLSTPKLVRRHLDHAEAVGFFSRVAHNDFSLISVLQNPTSVYIHVTHARFALRRPYSRCNASYARKAKADKTEAMCTPRDHHLGAFCQCRSIGCDVCTRSDFPVRCCRTHLDRGETSNPRSLHKYCGSPRCRHLALPRSC